MREDIKQLARPARKPGVFDINVPYIQESDLVRRMRIEKRLMNISVLTMTSEESLKIHADGKLPRARLLPKPFSRASMKTMFNSLVGPDKPQDGNAN
jgi:hypothetical protein